MYAQCQRRDDYSKWDTAIPALIEVPLVLYQKGTQSSNRADLDNQITTYLNIDANNEFTPPNNEACS